MEKQVRLTVGDLKKHRGEIRAWVRVFDEDGEYVVVSKTKLLRAIGADVAFHRGGLHPTTLLSEGSRIRDGVLYID